MLVMTVQITIPVTEINEKITAVMFFVVSFLWDFRFHFGSVFKIINLEYEIFR
jgi:hypothetical protein